MSELNMSELNIFNTVREFDIDQLLNILPNLEKNNLSSDFWRDLLINYNEEYYDIIKEYNNNIDFKELYLDFLSIEKDGKEDKLEDLIFNNIYSNDLEEYEELAKLYDLDYDITDITDITNITNMPDELMISTTKNLDYIDIIALCSINKKFSEICSNDSNWKLIFKIKYPNTLSYLTKRNLDTELNYESVIKELSILSYKETNLEKYLEESITSGNLYAVHILIENYNIEQNIINDSIIRNLIHSKDYLKLVKYLTTISINSVINSNILNRLIIHGNIDIIKFLVDEYKEVTLYLEIYKFDIISIASRWGHLELLKYLLNLRLDDFTPLESVMYNNEAFVKAALYEHLDILKYLVSLCEDDEDCIYKMVTSNNNVAGGNILFHENYIIADYLFSLSEDSIINDNNIYSSVRFDRIDTLKYLVNLGGDLSTIIDGLVMVASENGNLEILKYLLNLNNRNDNDKQSIVMAQNSESLRRAISKNNLNVVKYLVGLFSNNKKDQINFVTSQNNRDVNAAYERGYTDIVNYLLSVGAKLHTSNTVLRFFGNIF